MKRIKTKYYGAFGFFGLFGFLYFFTHQTGTLFFFSFLSFFSFYLLGPLMDEMPDERYLENSAKARQKSSWIPLMALFFIGWSSSFPFFSKELTVLVSSLGWSATFIAYALLFVHYEKH